MSRTSKKADATEAAATPKPTAGSKQVWKLMDRGSSVASAVLARQVSEGAWKLATGKRPPSEKTNLDPSVREIALWAFVGGGLAELVACSSSARPLPTGSSPPAISRPG